MRRLRDADGLILNLAPFRGIEPEFETALEVGAAIALGLPRGGLWLFARQLMAPFGRVAHVRGVVRDADGAGSDTSGCRRTFRSPAGRRWWKQQPRHRALAACCAGRAPGGPPEDGGHFL